MINFPKTTYTFSAYTHEEDTGNSTDVRVEFTTEQETVSEILEKFADFMRASGFSYIQDLEYTSFHEAFDEDNSSDPHEYEFTTGADIQPDLFDDMYSDVNVTYAGVDASDVDLNLHINPESINVPVSGGMTYEEFKRPVDPVTAGVTVGLVPPKK